MKKFIATLIIVLFIGVGYNITLALVTKAVPESKKPQRKVERLGASLTIGSPFGAKAPSMETSSRIEWDYGDKGVAIYDVEPSAEYKEGGFEIDILLNSVPKNNKFFLQINSTDLNFIYQPPLDEDPHLQEGLTCTPTECFNGEGLRVIKRPENIVGSYAVYHSSKRNHKQGEENYGSGKVFHIYRPKIIDALGDWVWGEMKINGGLLSITVPRDFLDNAVYPVIVDPVLGYDTSGATQGLVVHDTISLPGWDDNAGNTMSEDGTAVSVWWYIGGGGGVDAMKAAIYEDSSGTPDGFLEESTGGPSYNASTAGWAEFTGFSASMTDTDIYYPAIWGVHDWDNLWVYYDVGDEAADQMYGDGETYGAWPANLTETTVGDWQYFSAYIEYTAGGGGGDPAPKPPPPPIIMF